METRAKIISILNDFTEAVKAADAEKGERMLAFCEGAAWALTMARDPEDDRPKEDKAV